MAKKRDRIQEHVRPISRLDARGWAGALAYKSKEQLESLIETLPEGPKRSGAMLVLSWRENAVHLSDPTTMPPDISGGPPQSIPKKSHKKNAQADKTVRHKGKRSPIVLRTEKWAHMLRNESTEQLIKIVRTKTNCSKRSGAQVVLAKRRLGPERLTNSSIALTTVSIGKLKDEMISESTLVKAVNLLATLSIAELVRISDNSESLVICELAKQNCALIASCTKSTKKSAGKPVVKPLDQPVLRPSIKPGRGRYSSRLKPYAFVKHHRVKFLRGGMQP